MTPRILGRLLSSASAASGRVCRHPSQRLRYSDLASWRLKLGIISVDIYGTWNRFKRFEAVSRLQRATRINFCCPFQREWVRCSRELNVLENFCRYEKPAGRDSRGLCSRNSWSPLILGKWPEFVANERMGCSSSWKHRGPARQLRRLGENQAADRETARRDRTSKDRRDDVDELSAPTGSSLRSIGRGPRPERRAVLPCRLHGARHGDADQPGEHQVSAPGNA